MTQTVLITRPAPDAEQLAEEISSLVPEASVICAPVMGIDPVAWTAGDATFSHLILTSRHAIAAAKPYFGTPVFCVGTATAERAQAEGHSVSEVFDTADDLVAAVSKRAIGHALHLHGRHTRGNIADRLGAAGIPVTSVTVYEQRERDWSAEEAQAIFETTEMILPVYSPRSAQILGQRLEGYTGTITLVAISEACVKAWTGPVPVQVVISERPNGAAMKRALASLRAG